MFAQQQLQQQQQQLILNSYLNPMFNPHYMSSILIQGADRFSGFSNFPYQNSVFYPLLPIF